MAVSGWGSRGTAGWPEFEKSVDLFLGWKWAEWRCGRALGRKDLGMGWEGRGETQVLGWTFEVRECEAKYGI